jgi:hypothetical protein
MSLQNFNLCYKDPNSEDSVPGPIMDVLRREESISKFIYAGVPYLV